MTAGTSQSHKREIPRDGPKLTGAKLEARLAETWKRPPGFIGWLSSVDHKDIATRYVVTALTFLALAGVLALAMLLPAAYAVFKHTEATVADVV